MIPFGLKQFRTSGCLSYLVHCLKQNQAILIDPHPQLLEDYRDYLFSHALKLAYVLDTHTHADHFSASHLIKQEFNVPIAMCHRTRSLRVTLKLKEGEPLALGSLSLYPIETPGHTPDSLCLQVKNSLFTGDTLLIGSTGRTDFPESDQSILEASNKKLFSSHPKESLVFPGHDYNDLLFSTLEAEKLEFASNSNSHLDPDGSLNKKRPLPSEISSCIQYNLEKNPSSLHAPSTSGSLTQCGIAPITENMESYSLGVEKYFNKLKEAEATSEETVVAFIDVREKEEFEAGHIPKTRNIPLSEIGFHLKMLQSHDRIYFSCLSGRRSMRATKTLVRLGFQKLWNITGGFKAWTLKGYSIQK